MPRLRWSWPVVALLAACASGGITPIETSFNRGVHLYSVGALDAAIDEYRDALEEDPADWRARFNLAATLERRAGELAALGEAERAARLRGAAEQEYRALIARGSGGVRASVNLAALEAERGDVDGALARLRVLQAAHPDVAFVATALAAQQLAHGDARDAVATLTTAVERDPADASAQRLLGAAYRRLGEVDRARTAFEAALTREPDDLATLRALGTLELEAGHAEAAATWLERLLLIDPDHAEGHALRSLAMEQLGEFELATMHAWLARRSGRLADDAAVAPARLLGLYERLAAEERARVDTGR